MLAKPSLAATSTCYTIGRRAPRESMMVRIRAKMPPRVDTNCDSNHGGFCGNALMNPHRPFLRREFARARPGDERLPTPVGGLPP